MVKSWGSGARRRVELVEKPDLGPKNWFFRSGGEAQQEPLVPGLSRHLTQPHAGPTAAAPPSVRVGAAV